MARIGIYTAVAPARTGGVGRWLDGLLLALQAVDRENEYWLLGRADPLAPNFRAFSLPVRAEKRFRNHFYTAFWLPRVAEKLELDLLHIPNTMPVISRRCATLVSVYDIVEFGLPYRVYEPHRHHYRRLVHRLIARRARHLITGTHHAQREMTHHLGVPPDRITTIYPGLEPRFQPPSAAALAAVRQRHELPDRYILYVGKIQPRKNIARLLRAFATVHAHEPTVSLVLAGQPGWMADDVQQLLQTPPLRNAVRLTGFVDDQDLPAFYGGATFLAFPSLYEGFGFPILEAMACGTPVMTSNGTSLAEVAGDAALLVNPLDERDLVRGMEELLGDPQLRARLRARGIMRARDFSWETCGRETAGLYARLTGR
jgi:glycosyltransferase involved in cell wall biosynthesis